MGDPVAQVHQGGQQPVDEHQPVPGAGPDRPLPRPIGQPRVLARLPARPQFDDQLSEALNERLWEVGLSSLAPVRSTAHP
jgi:hypothetical protein